MIRIALLLLAFFALTGARDPILVPEVSQHEVKVRQGFTGTELLLFGAILDPAGTRAARGYDVVVVLKGPSEPIRLREKSKIGGMWLNAASTDFRSAPSFFAVAASRPVKDIVDERTAAIYEFGTDFIQLSPTGEIDPAEQARFTSGLVAWSWRHSWTSFCLSGDSEDSHSAADWKPSMLAFSPASICAATFASCGFSAKVLIIQSGA